MSENNINVCMIGYRFMGRAHSNAYLKVDKFFDVPIKPIMHTIVGRNAADLEAFAQRWGWLESSTDWKKAITDEGIDFAAGKRPHELPLKAELKSEHFIAGARFPGLFQGAFTRDKNGFGEVRL